MKYFRIRGLRFFTALCVTLFVFASSSMFTLAAPAGHSSAGEISVFGPTDNVGGPLVTVNGEQVASGRTFFSASVVETSASSFADINLGKLGRVSVSPDSVLSLSFAENSISGNLSAGKIKVINSAGVSVSIETPDNTVVNTGDLAGNFTVDLRSGKAEAVAEAGSISFRDGRPVGRAQTSNGNNSILIPLAILIGAVVVAIIVSESDGDDVVVSPIR